MRKRGWWARVCLFSSRTFLVIYFFFFSQLWVRRTMCSSGDAGSNVEICLRWSAFCSPFRIQSCQSLCLHWRAGFEPPGSLWIRLHLRSSGGLWRSEVTHLGTRLSSSELCSGISWASDCFSDSCSIMLRVVVHIQFLLVPMDAPGSCCCSLQASTIKEQSL